MRLFIQFGVYEFCLKLVDTRMRTFILLAQQMDIFLTFVSVVGKKEEKLDEILQDISKLPAQIFQVVILVKTIKFL